MKTHLTISTKMMTMFRVLMPCSFSVSVLPIGWSWLMVVVVVVRAVDWVGVGKNRMS